jgi:hypothetical protein
LLLAHTTFVGIDLSGGHHPFTYAVLDQDCQLISLKSGEIEDVVSFLDNLEAAIVAVNAPACPNKGLVRRSVERLGLTAGHLRGTDLRMAEQELRQRGILISPTPSRKETCAPWMQAGFSLYSSLGAAGFRSYPAEDAPRQWLETHPHAAFCVLLGQLPLPKPTLEGRLQRQLVLHANDVGIKDPMGFFEEVTRHWLLKGVLPMQHVYNPEQLDALVAALTACVAARGPDNVVGVGDKTEGQIVLPVSRLLEAYSSTV